ncbi:Rhodanese-like protein [Eremomyces bilateralis CBS 781.70]|uniref:Rhodanese-like protein n=1 Tax=Eremomyces bilateralis CBS 781.70 TaxID=1392243 RepID=A0A6G1G122_9PEZI|nr:Rhodanese-like protein [Eremomyces bilateralis CBS 781.70]KAF1811626.1 Rhodanese-like protein [Eremomyces bilateralis CBS 781.70]
MATEMPFSSYLITPKELHEALQKSPPSETTTLPRTIPLSAASFPPGDGRTGLDAFRERRIPNARFLDLGKVVDKHSNLPNMLPSARDFASAMSALGISRDDTVVVYDTFELGITSAPRAAWMLKVFGHATVHVLNNFKLWVENDYPTEFGEPPSIDASHYPTPDLDASKVVNFDQVKEVALNYNQGGPEGAQILDARPYGRWVGTTPEPRHGLSSGHIPGSISVPVSDLLDPQTKTFLPAEQLIRVFKGKGVDPARPIITSCGSGVTAAVIDAALAAAKYGNEENRRLYDGSWSEWAQRVNSSNGLIEKFAQ